MLKTRSRRTAMRTNEGGNLLCGGGEGEEYVQQHVYKAHRNGQVMNSWIKPMVMAMRRLSSDGSK
jgi:hypothetical protein